MIENTGSASLKILESRILTALGQVEETGQISAPNSKVVGSE